IEAAGTTLEDCKISGSQGDGIEVFADGVSLTGCKISGSGGNGCSVAGSNGTLTKNRATGSAASRFTLEAGVAGNVLTKNKAPGSQDFDLFDDSGDPQANSYDKTNKFKTIGITSP